MSLKEICRNYFETFSNQDLAGLGKLFADNISLRDWEIQANGKQEVLDANQKIFNGVDNIQVNPLRLYEDGNIVIAELKINTNVGKEMLLVVDVIAFDNEKKITAIRAYKG